MQLSPEEIKNFRQLWDEEFGEDIDDARALREAQRLLVLVSFATQPIPPELKDAYEKFKQQNKEA